GPVAVIIRLGIHVIGPVVGGLPPPALGGTAQPLNEDDRRLAVIHIGGRIAQIPGSRHRRFSHFLPDTLRKGNRLLQGRHRDSHEQQTPKNHHKQETPPYQPLASFESFLPLPIKMIPSFRNFLTCTTSV